MPLASAADAAKLAVTRCRTARGPLYLHGLGRNGLDITQTQHSPHDSMRFTLIDRIASTSAGCPITAVKSLTMAEEYLADHFPNFPVMPGVLMLEAMTQAGAWLVRPSEDFAHSMVVL